MYQAPAIATTGPRNKPPVDLVNDQDKVSNQTTSISIEILLDFVSVSIELHFKILKILNLIIKVDSKNLN